MLVTPNCYIMYFSPVCKLIFVCDEAQFFSGICKLKYIVRQTEGKAVVYVVYKAEDSAQNLLGHQY